jgi:uncharacterized protein (DUF58 family)
MTFLRLVRAGLHSVLLFALPWAVGLVVGACVDASQVKETGARFATLFGSIAVPLLVLQVTAIAVKVGRERKTLAVGGKSGFAAFAVAVDRHANVLTGRGLGLAVVGSILVGLALAAKFAELGVIAIAAVGLLYLFATLALVISAFSVRGFDARVVRGRGTIERELSPAVVDAGDEVEERFLLARVPVPMGFRLHIDEELPLRLGGATRFALDRSVSRAETTVSAPLPRTARGVYALGPASIWYEDLLGLTRVFVASRATAGLRVLPRLRPLAMSERPRAQIRSDGRMSILQRQASEDFFATREYRRGDDLRRVHWRQSVNTGALQVRVPEAVPFAPRRVRLVLDTFLPTSMDADDPQMGDLLDLLVEGWVAIAHTLVRRGEKVTLATALKVDGNAGADPVPRELECKRGEERKARAFGAEVVWQSRVPLDMAVGTGWNPSALQLVISAGFAPLTVGATSLILADIGDAPVPPAPRSPWKRLMVHPYPVGADDNAVDWRAFFSAKPGPARAREEVVRVYQEALEQARMRNQAILCLRRKGPQLALEAP